MNKGSRHLGKNLGMKSHCFILVMFIEDPLSCLADVFHSVYGNVKRNTNIEDSEFHKKGVVTVTKLLLS